MKLTDGQYTELVDKLADEILDSVGFEKEAGVKDSVGKAFGNAKKVLSGSRVRDLNSKIKTVTDSGIKGGEKAVEQMTSKRNRELVKTYGARAGVGAGVGAGVAGVAKAVGSRNEKTAEELTEEQIQAILEAKKREMAEADAGQAAAAEMEEKAAAVYEYALNKIAACQEMYADGVYGANACMEVLAEAGLLYEDGSLCKEAAEADEDSIIFTNKVADEYDDSLNKVAAAEECYAEACEELGAAMEVLAGFGYDFE